MASFIMKERDIGLIFEVSGLLNSPEMKHRKEAGELIGDKEVVQAVLEELVKEKHRNGVVVDGFPRTLVQANCIMLLFDKLQERFNSAQTNPSLRAIARRPIFNIACLYCDENVSIKRQIARGKVRGRMQLPYAAAEQHCCVVLPRLLSPHCAAAVLLLVGVNLLPQPAAHPMSSSSASFSSSYLCRSCSSSTRWWRTRASAPPCQCGRPT